MRSSSAHTRNRPGHTLVEFALVSALTLFLFLGLIVGGMGVFRYTQVAHLAREGARYACVHGGSYQQDGIPSLTKACAISSDADMRAFLVGKATALSPERLTIRVSWSAPAGATPTNMPTYVNTDPNLSPPGQQTIRNYVTVTVSYQWMPETLWVGPLTLTSVSTMPMSY